MEEIITALGNAELLGTYSSTDPEWHSIRAQGIGGSEIGTIMGLNPWESAYTLWHKKKGLIPDQIQENWSIRFGKAFEAPILQLFAEEHPELEIIQTGTWRSKCHSFQHANPDAIFRNKETGEFGIVEVKTSRASWDDVPPAYRAQVNWYLDTFKFQRGYIVAVAGWNYEEHEVFYDEFEAAVATTFAKRFWDSLEANTKPDWDGSESTYETVRKVADQEADGEIEIGELGIALIARQIEFNKVQAELQGLKSSVLEQMGNAKWATVTLDDGVVDRVASKQRRGEGLPYLQVRKV